MNNGAPLDVIQNLLGHEKSDTPNSAEVSDGNYIGSIFNIKISNALALLYCTFALVSLITNPEFPA